jgi:Mn2+/Fe2+ NRAMP family transporter
VKKVLEVALGVVTSVGGFLEAGSLATAAQAGAAFRFQLLWAIVLGTICVAVLTEMSGRLAAVSGHTLADAMRERFGFTFFVVPLIAVGSVSVLTLGAELGGVCKALSLAVGLDFRWFAAPVMVAAWALLWRGSFGVIEKGVSLLGLITIAFLVAVIKLHPPLEQVASGLLVSRPAHDPSHYWFLAVSILGASLTPYLFYFYSSGAIEDEWNEGFLTTNRFVAGIGMTFGGVLSAAILVIAAMVFWPHGVHIERYDQIATMLDDAFGAWGRPLFLACLAIACFGAVLEIALALAYLVAQGLGWNWGKNVRPREAARFSITYTLALVLATALVVIGLDPLRLTNVTMALSAAVLPLAVGPFIVLMNDRDYVGGHANGRTSNAIVVGVIALACVLALVALPLQLMGSS